MVNATPRPLYPREWPGTHCVRGWMGPRAGVEVYGNPEFDSRTVQPVASCYTNCAIPSHRIGKLKSHIFKDIPQEPEIYVIINL